MSQPLLSAVYISGGEFISMGLGEGAWFPALLCFGPENQASDGWCVPARCASRPAVTTSPGPSALLGGEGCCSPPVLARVHHEQLSVSFVTEPVTFPPDLPRASRRPGKKRYEAVVTGQTQYEVQGIQRWIRPASGPEDAHRRGKSEF